MWRGGATVTKYGYVSKTLFAGIDISALSVILSVMDSEDPINEAIKKLLGWVKTAESIAVVTGAGISTASGIPDFRSASGIYADERNVNVFDMDAFRSDPSIFYNFAREFYPKVRNAQPNVAHRTLAAWQQQRGNVTVITQNVDDYHQRAGSSPVYTVHGDYIHSTCLRCDMEVETESLFPVVAAGNIPRCSCGGVFKPNITFFGEQLPEADWNAATQAVTCADLVLVLGSSLTVYPAALLPCYRSDSARLVIINREPTRLDCDADLVIHDDLCSVISSVKT